MLIIITCIKLKNQLLNFKLFVQVPNLWRLESHYLSFYISFDEMLIKMYHYVENIKLLNGLYDIPNAHQITRLCKNKLLTFQIVTSSSWLVDNYHIF